MTRIVVDVAGAAVGGARRFLGELDRYLNQAGRDDVEVIGRGEALTASWLVRREQFARRAAIRIAINNASFAAPGGTRIVALRNALHFASDGELSKLGYAPPRSLQLQVPVIRGLARRADRIEVPCTAMAERVRRHLPGVSGRLDVRHHPVTQRPWANTPGAAQADLLVPVLSAPYKRLDLHVAALLEAQRSVPELERILITATPDELPHAQANDTRIKFLGRLTHEELDQHWASSRAIFFPTQLESFGYPLAEARANGRRAVALGTAQNREIAAQALAPYRLGDVESLALALRDAMTRCVAPDAMAFDPDKYFDQFLAAS